MPLLRRNLILSAATSLLLGASLAVAQDASTTTDAAGNSSTSASEAEQDAYAPQKVVYHVNFPGGEDGKGYGGVLSNLRNHVDAVGADNLDLRVVINGDGIELLQLAVDDQGLQGQIADLKAEGVQFLVCRNTLDGRDIDPESLFEVFDDDIIPSGVAEVAKLQMDGFAYIKP